MSSDGCQRHNNDDNTKQDTIGKGNRKYLWTYDGMHEYNGMVLPAVFGGSSIKEVQNFNFRNGDILVAGYPKSGE